LQTKLCADLSLRKPIAEHDSPRRTWDSYPHALYQDDERPLCANSGRTERISLDSANARPTDSTANQRENVTQSIVAKDVHDLRYIFVNRAAEQLFGMPPSGDCWKIGA
jgi:hypothetical protein